MQKKEATYSKRFVATARNFYRQTNKNKTKNATK